MTTREYGNHIKLNHKRSTSIKDINEYQTKLVKHKTKAASYPSKFSLASKYKMKILDQGDIGSCVVNVFCGIINSLYGIDTSRLYYYFNARVGTGLSPIEDTGLYILRSYPILQSFGFVPETKWAYDTTKFSIIPPFATTYKIASITKPVKFEYVQQKNAIIKSALLANKFIMTGITIYSSFMKYDVASTGIIPLPDTKTETLEGYHCVIIIGWCIYNNISYYIIRNSWGKNWGNDGKPIPTPNFINNGSNGGFGYIPQTYITDIALAFELLAIS